MMLKKGDLVELSAYGKKIKILSDFHGKYGLVLQAHFGSVLVEWPHKTKPLPINRRDIKKVRSSK